MLKKCRQAISPSSNTPKIKEQKTTTALNNNTVEKAIYCIPLSLSKSLLMNLSASDGKKVLCQTFILSFSLKATIAKVCKQQNVFTQKYCKDPYIIKEREDAAKEARIIRKQDQTCLHQQNFHKRQKKKRLELNGRSGKIAKCDILGIRAVTNESFHASASQAAIEDLAEILWPKGHA